MRSPATVRDTQNAERPRRPDPAAGLRRLQRELGNRGFAAALGRRTLARDVESEQVAADARFPQAIKDLAAAALALPADQRGAKAISITTQMLDMYVPESLDRLVEWRYVADAKGFELLGAKYDKAQGLQVGTLHVGDDALKRLAAGKVDELADELRRALQGLNDADIDAGRTGIVRIGAERVRVKSRQEADDARRIVALAKDKFGIGLDSMSSRRAARAYYAQKGETDDHLRTTEAAPWEYAELQGLERAMQHYAPLLGSGRRRFTFGKLTVAADDKPGDPDDHSAGEYFDADKTAVLYDELPKSLDKGDPDAYERHATHESRARGVRRPGRRLRQAQRRLLGAALRPQLQEGRRAAAGRLRRPQRARGPGAVDHVLHPRRQVVRGQMPAAQRLPAGRRRPPRQARPDASLSARSRRARSPAAIASRRHFHAPAARPRLVHAPLRAEAEHVLGLDHRQLRGGGEGEPDQRPVRLGLAHAERRRLVHARARRASSDAYQPRDGVVVVRAGVDDAARRRGARDVDGVGSSGVEAELQHGHPGEAERRRAAAPRPA